MRAARGIGLAPLALGLLIPIQAAWPLDPRSLVAEVEPSLVRVLVESPDGPGRGSGSGSGFVVADGGWIATNHHVIAMHLDRGWQVRVLPARRLGDKASEPLSVEVVASWEAVDLALLRVPELGRPPLRLAVEADIEAGTPIYGFGFPGAADRLGPAAVPSVVTGLVSRSFEGRWTDEGALLGMIQHTAATNPGTSGGPLVNACGEVVGINTQREVRAVRGPFGVPLLTDAIQGVFFAGDTAALHARLRTAGLELRRAAEACIVGPDRSFQHLTAALAVMLLLTVVGLALLLTVWRRLLIALLVRCDSAVEDCERAIRRALEPRKS